MTTADISYTQSVHRLLELVRNPLQGNYDRQHLQAVNHYIFQDVKTVQGVDIKPGEFRDKVFNQDWMKNRRIETVGEAIPVFYSQMDGRALQHLDNTLKRADPNKLSSLNTADFTKEIADIYANVDYVHPFREGNSRTLRAFTHQLAKDSGYVIKWQNFNENQAGRDILCIARDKSVNQIALPRLLHESSKRQARNALYRYGLSRDLPDLLQDVVEPDKAAFLQQYSEALKGSKLSQKQVDELIKQVGDRVDKYGIKNCSLPPINKAKTKGHEPER